MGVMVNFDLLSRALDQTGQVIGRVRPDQANSPTPCPDWNVRALVNHTVYDLTVFTSMLTGAERGSTDVDLIGEEWQGAYRRASDGLLQTWNKRGTEGTIQSRMGELPLTWVLGQHMADIAVHGWDLAKATGQSPDLDADVGQASLEWGRQNLKPQFRGQAFGPEVSVPKSAPIYDRLAAFFGRDPAYVGSQRPA